MMSTVRMLIIMLFFHPGCEYPPLYRVSTPYTVLTHYSEAISVIKSTLWNHSLCEKY